ncbi:type I-MYXAN CRISPR-associated protein Cas5/Cmx5/DevS [Hyalangium versicolor]|uniref:type I-MYXAN CRISPR-associated protein Cas5/Cmx5/DevS n=1 Tax=Hyalangium versicolor TaxID=2861190 RepID=UPI001CD032EB|nr:type I-MYXAN CRISPR-associated protein Cas5/Cmx5/DevS [Hyalangium versicolor]
MKRLWLRARAPFAAFRPLQAGVYRTTARTFPPSAAYGLLLNLAGIESRSSGSQVTTSTREGLPKLRLAIGNVHEPSVGTLYQQLHGYLVGNSGKEFKRRSHGSKYWIAPVRREVLIGLDCVMGFETDELHLVERVEMGLQGRLPERRYGLPFAGDNNFLFDRLDLLVQPPPTFWLQHLALDSGPRVGSARLTVSINRLDSSRTQTALMAPVDMPTIEPPESAWVWTPSQ